MAKWFAYVSLRDESRGALRSAYCAMMRTPVRFIGPLRWNSPTGLRPLDDGGIDAQ
jgi:hypothetical protein